MSDSNKIDMVGGLMMVAAMILALILSNTTEWYSQFVDFSIRFSWEFFTFEQSIKHLVKDCLMVIFFVHVGMCLRYEFQEGCLSDHRQIILPLIAAVGGMVVPSLIYLAVNINHPENYPGFAIPCSTDIAFAICLFNLLGKGIPTSIKIFLLAIAVLDDIGGILIIAIFYTNDFNMVWFIIGMVPLVSLWLLNKYRITGVTLYALLGVSFCLSCYQTGISTSIAGFLIGFLVPLYKSSGEPYSKALEPKLQPFVQFFILPIFAFTSSGISFSNEHITALFDPIVVGIVLGLFLGKQLGITLFSYLTLRLGWAELPKGSRFFDIYNVSVFAGIGFTMSLFVGMIAFHEIHVQNLVKLGVMAALVVSVLFSGLLAMRDQSFR